jgi:iron complex outermembrane receptor protein
MSLAKSEFSGGGKAGIVLGGALICVIGSPAIAQQVDLDTQPVQTIQITGSNLPRTDTETPSPVQIITFDDLQKSGYTTVAEVLQHITANGQGTLSQGFASAFAAGATGMSLRGLKTSATLVLIDGHRTAPYPLYDDGHTSFVDVSNLPFDAIDRIEILKDGASSVYGSDAMAGVNNIILNKSMVSTKVTAETGTTTEGGGTTSHVSVMHGIGDFDADGFNAYGSLEYRHQDYITYAQRAGDGAWQNINWASMGGVNKTPGVITPQNPIPPTLSPYLTNPGVPFSGASNSTYFYPGACGGYTQLAAGGCAYQDPHAEVQPRTQNVNLLGSFSKNLGDGWKLELKASLFDSQTEQYPQFSTNGGLLTYPSSFSPLVAVAGGTPYLAGTTIPAITVPANYPGNPFGVPAVVHGVISSAPVPNTQLESKATRLVADLSGSIYAWDIDATIGYTKNSTQQAMIGNINVTALNAALNRPGNPFLVAGPNSASDLATIFPEAVANVSSELDFAEFHAMRSLLKLPGGDLAFGFGGSVVRDVLNAPAPALVGDGTVISNDNGNFTFASGTQTIASVYGEILAPISKTLELDGSIREDHVNAEGDATTPKFGFKWAPSEQFALRGTVGKGFRAPNPAETGQSGQVYQAYSTNDPVLCPGGIPATGNIAKGSVVSACNVQPLELLLANPNLAPEKSLSETFGVIVEPIRGWSSTFDLYQVAINNQVFPGAPSTTPVRGTPVQTQCADGSGGTYTCTPAIGPIVYYSSQFINANSVKTNGIDLDTRYKFSLGQYGNLVTDLGWTHIMSYVLTENGVSYQLAGTHGPSIIGADTGNPKDKVQLTISWLSGGWDVTTIINWMSSFDLTDPSSGMNTCAAGAAADGWFPGAPPPSQYCKVGAFLETDLSVRYKIDKRWTLHASVTNLFNQAPPVDLATFGGGQLPFNPSMHLPGAIGRFVNVGANLSF